MQRQYKSPIVVNRGNAIQKIISRPQTNRGGAGGSRTGAPQFPGANSGLSIPQLQNLIQQQPRCTGVNFVAPAGNFTIQQIALPGDAKLLLGIIFTPGASNSDTFNLSINNNKVVDNASIFLHSSANSQSIKTQYYEYLQPLSGKDAFEIVLNTSAGLTGVIDFHYI